MRIAGITRDSIVDGVGIRDVIFVQGCPHHCQGCHNPSTWNPRGGTNMGMLDIKEALEDSENNITISGGEPIKTGLCRLLVHLHFYFPEKTFWVYTGYRYEEIDKSLLLVMRDCGVEVIVDGRFEKDKKDPKLRFRGSSNQRLVDLKRSLASGQIVSWEETK